MDYKKAGVDTEKARHLISDLKGTIEKTHKNLPTGNIVSGLGGFAGIFSQSKNYQNQDIVACTDGVGTKIDLCRRFSKLDGLGFDLVAMCVNDLYCTGATPAFFLDYISCGKLDESWYLPLMNSIAQACSQSKIALLGGETAEHPGVMKDDEFDLAGFCVGFVDSAQRLPKPETMIAGDALVAIASSGLHSNGFSLVRKVLSKIEKNDAKRYQSIIDDKNFVDRLLMPTRIYHEFSGVSQNYNIKAIAHITGGGIYENLPRVLPENITAHLSNYENLATEIFQFFTEFSDKKSLYQTFNMGIGLVLVMNKDDAKNFCSAEDAQIIGELTEKQGDSEIILAGIDT